MPIDRATADTAVPCVQQVSSMFGSFTRQLRRLTTRSASCLRRDDTSLGPLGFNSTLYPVHLRTRKSPGDMMRKLSVTLSQSVLHLLGTSRRRKPGTASQKPL